MYQANTLTISKVENGFVLHVSFGGSVMDLIAPDKEGVINLVRLTDFITPRPLLINDGINTGR